MKKDNSSTFFNDVHELTKLIPKGRVCSYGAIARALGKARGARAVGWALNNAALLPDVPAHRVVNSKGVLSGKNHFGGNRMQELLEAEGITVKDDKIVDFDQLYWNPNIELFK